MQPEQRATVKYQIEFHITTATISLEIALALAIGRIFAALEYGQIGIDEIVSRMYIHYQITYQENRELIKSVLNIGVQLPLDEMFEISQHRPDLPISISVYHDEIDRFIQVYLWVILILLKEGYQYDFEDGYLEDGICSICCDSSLKDIVRIVRGCGHSFCRSCFSRALTLQRKCPMPLNLLLKSAAS